MSSDNEKLTIFHYLGIGGFLLIAWELDGVLGRSWSLVSIGIGIVAGVLITIGSRALLGDDANDMTYSSQAARAEKGIAESQYNLGKMYHNGYGVEQDYKLAIKWYQLAVEQGISDAQCNLGLMYFEGEGVTPDSRAAFDLMKKAAEQGNITAQNNLGYMYENGEGDDRNLLCAYAWYDISASQGDKQAKVNLDHLKQEMDLSDQQNGEALAREYVANGYKE